MAEFMDTNKTDNSDEDKRPQFGNRLLTDPRNVFQHNAWDNVVWDDEQEQEAKQITERQLACPMSEQDQGITSYPVDCPVTKEKRESDANEYWNTFYGIHQNRFFKDRHWLFTEFPELLPKSSSSGAGNVASASSKPDDTLAQTADCCVPNTGTVIGDSLTGGTGQSNNVTFTGVDNIQEICNAAAYSSGNVTAHSANSLTPALGDMSIVNTAERTASNSTDTIHSSGDKTIDLGESGEPTSDDVTVNDRDEESGDGDSDKTVDNNKDIVPEAVKERYPGESATYRILEVGCGVGNTVFPILLTNNMTKRGCSKAVAKSETGSLAELAVTSFKSKTFDPGLMVYCCDFSSTAVNLVKENPNYNPRRCCAFVCDIADDTSTVPFPGGSLDIIILIFVLSAVHPSKMQAVIDRLAGYLKPGGVILFRDYGRYDMAQLRFKKGRCLSENFYARGDGTMVYFFTQDELREMMTRAGLVEKQNLIDRRLQVNRGKQLKMYRVWIQCKYVKPVQNS